MCVCVRVSHLEAVRALAGVSVEFHARLVAGRLALRIDRDASGAEENVSPREAPPAYTHTHMHTQRKPLVNTQETLVTRRERSECERTW